MNKYYDDVKVESNSRYSKNVQLYQEINKGELSNYNIKSNATIIGENKNEIDIEKIKKILDTKYNETPKRKSIRLEETEEKEEEKEITKEYDINVILEKAREEKEVNYEEERLKKLRNTQFDILKNLNLENITSDNKQNKNEDNDLESLINTIHYNECKDVNKKDEEDNILSELMGSGNTEVIEGLKEDVDEYDEENDKLEDTKMINSFYTSSNALKNKDFEEIDDFAKDVESNNTFLKIIIAFIILVFLVGVVLIIKTLIA